MRETKITILGAGAWGTILAKLAAANGHNVHLWSRSGAMSLEAALEGAEIVLSAVSMKGVRSVATEIQSLSIYPRAIFVTATKGLEPFTTLTPAQIWRSSFPTHPVQRLKLNHVVITSVNRDDLLDGGASQFVGCIEAIRATSPQTTIEVLIPDLCGNWQALETILQAAPEVLNHNTETVPRLYRRTRPQGDYDRTLELIKRSRAIAPGVYTKSGLMVGLGETDEEIRQVMLDLRSVDCDILTLGQYLQPSQKHLQVQSFVTPEQFDAWRIFGESVGFLQVVSSPLTRSSYHAEKVRELMQRYPRK